MQKNLEHLDEKYVWKRRNSAFEEILWNIPYHSKNIDNFLELQNTCSRCMYSIFQVQELPKAAVGNILGNNSIEDS